MGNQPGTARKRPLAQQVCNEAALRDDTRFWHRHGCVS
jgi:hypothetical protein